MNYRKKLLITLCILLVISVSSYLYATYIIGCNHRHAYSCSTFFFNELASVFIATPLFVSASLLFTLIFSENVFKMWKKFAMITVPLMVIGILLVKVNPIACGNLICIDRTFMIFLTGIIYLILSFITTIISAVYFNSKMKQS